jgi:hypothetical protein
MQINGLKITIPKLATINFKLANVSGDWGYPELTHLPIHKGDFVEQSWRR